MIESGFKSHTEQKFLITPVTAHFCLIFFKKNFFWQNRGPISFLTPFPFCHNTDFFLELSQKSQTPSPVTYYVLSERPIGVVALKLLKLSYKMTCLRPSSYITTNYCHYQNQIWTIHFQMLSLLNISDDHLMPKPV